MFGRKRGEDVKSLPEKRKGAFSKILQWAIVLTIFVFLGKTVWDHWNQVKDTPFTLRALPFILSTAIFAFSYFIQIWAWYLITLKLGIALSFQETSKSWLYSQLGKYLPGKFWLLLSRFYFYESRGKSKKTVSIGFYFEMLTIIMAAGLLFLMALPFLKEAERFYPGNRSWWLPLPFILAFIFLHPKVLQKILNWALLQFKKEPISLSISYPDMLWILLVCIISWMVGGIGFYLFVCSVYPIPSHYILFLTGALAFSSILGIVAIFAPSGLGVREGVLVCLLSSVMSTPVAVIISVLTRLWMTFIEFGLIGGVYLSVKFRQSPEKRS
jgi:uncharacterized membrane protein YbhN (UPF0104 family)